MNALTFFNPRLATDLFDALDRNFPDYIPVEGKNGMEEGFFTPRVDVRETKDAYLLEMELPGFTDKDVDLSLKEKSLVISSKKEDKKEEKEGDWLIRERKSTSFSRRFTLPEDVDTEQVAASFKNGILTVKMPRKPEAQTRNIEIKSE